MLVGRSLEQERIEQLLDEARLGTSQALVIRGEAGIGKTALLEWASARAADMKILSVRGIESEVELSFAGRPGALPAARGSPRRSPGPAVGGAARRSGARRIAGTR